MRLMRVLAALEEADGELGQLVLPAYLTRPTVTVSTGDYL